MVATGGVGGRRRPAAWALAALLWPQPSAAAATATAPATATATATATAAATTAAAAGDDRITDSDDDDAPPAEGAGGPPSPATAAGRGDFGLRPWAEFVGRPVLAVEVEAPDPAEAERLRGVVGIAEGVLLAADEVQEAVKRLFASGRWGQVEVLACLRHDTVVLHFVLYPQPRVAEVEVEGLAGVGVGELRQSLRIVAGDEASPATEATLRRRAGAFLRRRGWPAARIEVAWRPTAEPGYRAYRLRIAQGAPSRAGRLVLEGTPRLAPSVVLSMMTTQPGDIIDQDVLEADRQGLAEAYRARGFRLVRVAEPRLVPRDDGRLDVHLSIAAGERLAVRFVGNRLLSDGALHDLFPAAAVEPVPRLFEAMAGRIQAVYLRQGYPFARVALRRLVPPPGEVVHMVYVIDEGPPAEVATLGVEGLTALEPNLVIAQIRGVIDQALGETPLVTPLLPGDGHGERTAGDEAQAPDSWRRRRPRRPSPVPVTARWVPELYQDAAVHVAHALRQAGYLEAEAEVGDPILARPLQPLDDEAAAALMGEVPAGGPAMGGLGRALEAACRAVVAEAGPAGTCPLMVTVHIKEGAQAFIDSVGFQGPTGELGAAELLACVEASAQKQGAQVSIGPGQPLAADASEEARIALVKHLRDRGYLYARVAGAASPASQAPFWRLDFAIDPGPRVTINQVLLRGNRFTRDGVVLSRMGLRPGDPYQLGQALADQRAIGELGVFRHVRVRLIDEERPAEDKDVVAEVVERQRHLIELAPGLSSANGPRLRATYSHLNLGGTASALTVQAKVNRQIFFDLYGDYAENMRDRFAAYHGLEQLTRAIDREARIGVRSPPIRALAFDPLFRVDVVELRINAVRYSFDSRRVILGVDGVLPRGIKGSLETQLGLVNLECNPLDPTCNQDLGLRHLQSRPLEVGEHWIFKGGPTFTWDHRDSPLSARRGVLASLRATGALGAQLHDAAQPAVAFNFVKLEQAITGYLPLGRAVLALSGRLGHLLRTEAKAPLDERFFLGGRDSIRGFFEGTLIPEDACFVATVDTPLPPGCADAVVPSLPNPDGSPNPPLSPGGNTFLLLKAELRVPVREQVAVALFVDLGNLWIDFPRAATFALRQGVGVGLRYTTPVGALAFDVGVNPAPRGPPWDETRTQLHFSIGSF